MIIDRRALLRRDFLAATAAAALFSAPAFAQASAGFNLCVQPGHPSCVFMPGRPAEACDREVEAYIAAVFHYRDCLAKESERAIRESNDVIDHWRCRERGERCQR